MKTLTILAFLASSMIVLGDDQEVNPSKQPSPNAAQSDPIPKYEGLDAIVIPELHFRNESESVLLDRIIKGMEKAGAYKKGFKGIIMSAPIFPARGTSFEFKNGPFGSITRELVGLSGLQTKEINGLITMAPEFQPGDDLCVMELQFTDDMHKWLNLKEPVTDSSLREALRHYGIEIKPTVGSRVIFLKSPDRLIIKTTPEDSKSISTFFDFLENGVFVYGNSKPTTGKEGDATK